MKNSSKKLDIVKMILMSVREMSVEWKDGVAPVNDPALQGNKDPKTGFNIEVNTNQLYPNFVPFKFVVRSAL